MLIPFVLIGMVFLIFLVSQVVPVDPAAYFLGARQQAVGPSEEAALAALEDRWGWNKPILERFVIYVGNLAQGDFGESSSTRRPVLDDLAEFLPATLELVIATMVVSLAIAVPLGVYWAAKRGGKTDHILNVGSVVLISTPTFWLALIGLNVFYKQLGWASAQGTLDLFINPPPRVTGMVVLDGALAGRPDVVLNGLYHLALPTAILSVVIAVYFARVVRSEMIEALDSDYVRTARGKGLRRSLVLYRHALRNALTATLTLSSLSFGSLLTGAIVVEGITGWPGLGSYAFRVITRLDLPAISGVALTVGAIYLILNLVVDVLYAVVDPRIRVR